MSKEQDFLRELKELFKKYHIKINHSLDYDYDEEICEVEVEKDSQTNERKSVDFVKQGESIRKQLLDIDEQVSQMREAGYMIEVKSTFRIP